MILARSRHDFPADDGQPVDPQHTGDLGEEPLDEPEVPACDAVDGGDGLGVGEVVCGQRQVDRGPAASQDEGELVGRFWPAFVDEPDRAVERGSEHGAFRCRHPDEDHAHLAAVVVVAQLLQARGLTTRDTRGHALPEEP